MADDDPAHARALRQAALRSSRERRHAAAATGAAGAEEVAVQDLLLRCILNWACALVGLGATVSEPCMVFAASFLLCLWVLEREEETPANVLTACHEGTTGCVVAAFWHSQGVLTRLFAVSFCLIYRTWCCVTAPGMLTTTASGWKFSGPFNHFGWETHFEHYCSDFLGAIS
jgi:hypothetical protein